MASYSAGCDIAAESEPSTGTKLDIAATNQIRPIATTTAIPTIHARICIHLRRVGYVSDVKSAGIVDLPKGFIRKRTDAA